MQKDVNYYLKLGCDEKIAKYFAEGTRTIVNVTANDDYTLTLTFDNGEVRIYDAKHLFTENSVFNKIKKEVILSAFTSMILTVYRGILIQM